MDSTQAYSAETPPELLCNYETTGSEAVPPKSFDLADHLEMSAAEATATYVEHELARIRPLLEIGEPYTSEDSCTTQIDFDARDVDLLQSIGYSEEIQRRYRAIPGDTSALVDFVEIFRQKCIALLSKRPAPKYVN